MLATISPPKAPQSPPKISRLGTLGGLFFCVWVFVLSACSGTGSVVVQTLQYVGGQWVPGAAANANAKAHGGDLPARPDPRYRYLRVQRNDAPPAMLVLGYVDAHPLGPIEVWYSATGEVLKLQDGRIVATHGLGADWPSVWFAVAPTAWPEVGAQGAVFERVRDALPSYNFGVREAVSTRPWQQTPGLQWPGPVGQSVNGPYLWYQEIARGPDGTVLVSWFGWGTHQGVQGIAYSEQCLTPRLCLRIQRWPLQEAGS